MNCEPDDLAVIVRTHPGEKSTKQFLGRIVRLREVSTVNNVLSWSYEDMPLRGNFDGKIVYWHRLPDEWLRPIRPDGLSQDEVDMLFLSTPVLEGENV